MGQIIKRSAAREDVISDHDEALVNANLRGGEIAEAAQERLAPLDVDLKKSKVELEAAHQKCDETYKGLMVADRESDDVIAVVHDEMKNAAGRSRGSRDMAITWSSGMSEWRNGPPEDQPKKMKILADRIRLSSAACFSTRKEEWATRIEEKSAVQAEAAKPYVDAETLVETLESQRATLAKHAHMGLVRFKRDLLGLGLTEVQAHEIIPNRDKPKTPKNHGSES